MPKAKETKKNERNERNERTSPEVARKASLYLVNANEVISELEIMCTNYSWGSEATTQIQRATELIRLGKSTAASALTQTPDKL